MILPEMGLPPGKSLKLSQLCRPGSAICDAGWPTPDCPWSMSVFEYVDHKKNIFGTSTSTASGPNVILLPVAADAKSAISAAQDAACCESAALHNPAFLVFLKTAQEWIDSYIRSNTTVKNLDDEQL